MELDYVIGLNQWNGAKYVRLDTFDTIVIETTMNDFPYINLGSKVTIDFGMISPTKVTITEEILEYTDNRFLPIENKNIAVKQKNRKISFDINKLSILGVNSYVTEDVYNIRGFRVIARWGQNECEYAFIIKTD